MRRPEPPQAPPVEPSLDGADREADVRALSKQIAALSERVAELTASERELRGRLLEAHEQISARDAELDRMAEDRERLFEEARRIHAGVNAMKRTRLWRMGAAWWRVRDRLLRRSDGGR